MEKSVSAVFLVMILVLSTGFACAGTKVTVKTLQYHPVDIIVADGTIKDYSKIAEFKGDANEYGDFVFSVDTSKPLINLYVHVKNPSNYSDEIVSEKFMGEETGSSIYLEAAPEGYELIATPKAGSNKTNVTEMNATLLETNETANETNLEELSDSKFTGSAVADFLTSKTFYIIIGVIVVLVVLFFVIRFFRKRRSENPGQEIRVRKLSEIQQEKSQDYRGVIDDAERKIKDAQDELRKLRSEEQIKAMRKKIADDERELMRLRRGQ